MGKRHNRFFSKILETPPRQLKLGSIRIFTCGGGQGGGGAGGRDEGGGQCGGGAGGWDEGGGQGAGGRWEELVAAVTPLILHKPIKALLGQTGRSDGNI